MSNTYPHLNNGDVANLLANHRLVQVNPIEQRYANDPFPTGDGLIAEIKDRLNSAPGDLGGLPSENEPTVQRMTPEAALNNVTSISDLDTLTDHYSALLIEAAPLVEGNELADAIGDLKSRVLTKAAEGLEPVRIETPAKGQSDAELVTLYNDIKSLEDLEAALSAEHGEEVLLAIVGMTDRIRASVIAALPPAEKVAEEPAPEQEQAADQA